jgi:hypothetical protein
MTTPLLETFTNFSSGLSDQKITTIVFENIPSQSPEKKVVGFWNPLLSKFIMHKS